MEKPTLQEWKMNNPGKGLNEYFKEYPVTANHISQNDTVGSVSTPQYVQSNQPEEKEALNIASILASVMIFIAFFLPWVDVLKPIGFIKLLGISYSVKFNGVQLLAILDAAANAEHLDLSTNLLKTIYLIPICAFLVIITEIQKSWLKPLILSIAVLTTIHWFFLLEGLLPIKVFTYGIYPTLFGCAFYTYEVIRWFFK